MKIDQLRGLVPQLHRALRQGGRTIKLTKSKSMPVDQDHFFEIPKHSASKKVVFIDGGNQEILGSVNYSLQLLRVAATTYEGMRQIASTRKENFCLTTTVPRKDSLFFETSLTPQGVSVPVFDIDDRSLAPQGKTPSVSLIPEVARRFSELVLAKEMVENLDAGDAVVLDGLITPHYTGEGILVEELLQSAKEKGVMVLGFAKTSRLMTESGSSAMEALAQCSPGGCWRYSAEKDASIANHFVRLHERAKHVFRIEVPRDDQEGLDDLLSVIKDLSADPIFLGYPYGLIATDRMARVSNNEKEYLKVALQSLAGESYKDLAQSLRAIDAHQILDTV